MKQDIKDIKESLLNNYVNDANKDKGAYKAIHDRTLFLNLDYTDKDELLKYRELLENNKKKV